MRIAALVLAAAVFAAGPASAQHRAVEARNFEVRTLDDLVTLCRAAPTDPLYLEAKGFCHGFGRGALDHFRAVTPRNARPLFCAPEGTTPQEARERFIAWADANPARRAGPAVEGVFAFLTATYPCPAQRR